MKINFQIPEILVIASCIFLLRGLDVTGWCFLGGGLFLSLCRTAMERQEREEQQDNISKSLNDISGKLLNLVGSYTKDINNLN